jgi:hypothetical protein
MITAFGPKSYARLVQAERLWQAGIGYTKVTIVVRSGVVALANIWDNIRQLQLRGVPWRSIFKGGPIKMIEANRHLKHEDERVKLRAKRITALAAGHKHELARLEARMQTLEDADRRMSIWPLIDAGFFNTISEGMTDADLAAEDDSWLARIQESYEKLPETVQTVGKNLVLSRDTEAFKLLNRMIQYGDFVAKGVYYDHLLEMGMLPAAALAKVREEFVNYNPLPGRSRGYLEAMGGQWFWSYKLRRMKGALSLMREDPLRVLTLGLVPAAVPGLDAFSSKDLVWDTNALGTIVGGRADHSLGLDMLSSGVTMQPYVNLVS